METLFETYNFNDYPPTEILNEEVYKKSIKSLSFQYRLKGSDKLIAYIAFSNEKPDVCLEGVDEHSNACRILEVFVDTSICKIKHLDSVEIMEKLLAESEYNVSVSDKKFNYIWTNTNDDNTKDLRTLLDKIKDNIAYKFL